MEAADDTPPLCDPCYELLKKLNNAAMYRDEQCPNFDTNPCQSLALKDVNLCVKYVAGLREVGYQCLHGSGDFPSRMKPLRVSIFGQKSFQTTR